MQRTLVCPSCHSKKVIQFGEDVPNNILYPYRTVSSYSVSPYYSGFISNTIASC